METRFIEGLKGLPGLPEACPCLPVLHALSSTRRGDHLATLITELPILPAVANMVCAGQLSGFAQSIAAPRAAIPLRQAARISRQVVCAHRSASGQQEQASTSQRYHPWITGQDVLAGTWSIC